MSYSVCLICDKMVSYYEKYCPECLKRYKLRQGDWRLFKLKTSYENKLGRRSEVLYHVATDTDLEVKEAINRFNEDYPSELP